MTRGQVAITLTLGEGLLALLAVGFFTRFATTWPIVALTSMGAFLLDRK